ncbi:MAG TPA: class I SAM-dependent methyltransferase [Solirubrobacteraceae bacterium]|nr:class I SAM-dependent methyltransferase [Solirubrobacteraceae bacterium]
MPSVETEQRGSASDCVSHPIFGRAYHRLFSPLIEREVAHLREELLADLDGSVLEVGAGNGASFARYPATVTKLVAIEPEAYLRAQALRAAAQAPVPTSVLAGSAESLPVADESFNAAVVSLVLCSVRDLDLALSELRRVLVPGGQLRFLEHVRSQRPRKARVQELLDRSIWPALAGGCHCARETAAAIEAAGFQIELVRRLDAGPSWAHTNPMLIGRARTPS